MAYDAGNFSSQEMSGNAPFFDNDPMLRPRNLRIQSVDEGQLDASLKEKLIVLQQLKQRAVDSEDFDTAIELKEITDKLKLIGSDLKMLELRKQEAIDGEDFETAKALKVQVERLR